eukprot:TRINITY_DN70348_c0_g1_i1.p1 TRINITY_DN70348_c0_g1~~TRINITY_DN70348_c0_g1_i1.p1  ORF type:complete len:697 (+),score=178.44 TRINITY_DN70348_c0_g1_i1:182-2272(+)
MQRLIPVIDRVRDVFVQAGLQHELELPQIAVVGAQSAGKSSVLEHIVGRDFLPRGTGIVTRRPLVLHLQNIGDFNDAAPQTGSDSGSSAAAAPPKSPAPEAQAWGRFDHCPDRKFFDFEQIRKEIDEETARACGSNKGVVDIPIKLTFFAPDVVNLTLIDLPGLTKNPVGDQPTDIEHQIRRMVLQYITPVTTIILAVTPANQDIANSDALQIAREVDPAGHRTIGVLTKLDLMDRGTDAMEVLTGKVYPLQRGYIGVVNRGQKDIEGRVNIRKALQAEEEFFLAHPRYSAIRHRMGTPYLARTLNQILLSHIRDYVPTLRTKIQEQMARTRSVLAQLGPGSGDGSLVQTLVQKLREYSHAVVSAVDGTMSERTTQDLKGGARINWIFNEAFVPHLKTIDAAEGLTDAAVATEIRNAKGYRNGLFAPEAAFEKLVRIQVERLEEPCNRCADHVFEELVEICKSQLVLLHRFPILQVQVSEYVVQLLQEYLAPLREHIGNVVKIETSYVNTQHPDFYGGGADFYQLIESVRDKTPQQALAQQQGQAAQGQQPQGAVAQGQRGSGKAAQPQASAAASTADPSFQSVPAALHSSSAARHGERERRESELLRMLVVTYFDIVRKNIGDGVPKAIIWFLVMQLKTRLHDALLLKFNREDALEELLKENDAVVQRRKSEKTFLDCLTTAMKTLAEVQTFSIA